MDQLVRELVPQVLGILVRRGADFAAAEDAVQEALVEAVRRWPDEPPDGPQGVVGDGVVAQVHRRRAVRVGASYARGAPGRRAGTRTRPRTRTTPCCCSSSPATPRSRRTQPWR